VKYDNPGILPAPLQYLELLCDVGTKTFSLAITTRAYYQVRRDLAGMKLLKGATASTLRRYTVEDSQAMANPVHFAVPFPLPSAFPIKSRTLILSLCSQLDVRAEVLR
jgi:hypothetical protein